ncbi:MAG TPA: hypothetical protein VIV66_21865 [Pyrinomonadaceae bacterium]
MPDDKMNNPEQEKGVSGKTGSQSGGQYGGGQQAPGRNPQDDKSTGQRGGQGGPDDKDDFGSQPNRQSGQDIGKGQGGSNR